MGDSFIAGFCLGGDGSFVCLRGDQRPTAGQKIRLIRPLCGQRGLSLARSRGRRNGDVRWECLLVYNGAAMMIMGIVLGVNFDFFAYLR